MVNAITELLKPKKTALTPYLPVSKSEKPVIRLGSLKPKKPPVATIGEQLNRLKDKPAIVRAIASPKVTGALAGTLGLLTGMGPIGAGILGTSIPVGAGVLKASPTIDKFVTGRVLDPIGSGEKAGRVAEKGFSIFDTIGRGIGTGFEKTVLGFSTAKEFISDNLPTAKTAGIALGAGALGLGAVGLYKLLSNKKAEVGASIVSTAPVGSYVYETPGAPAPVVETVPAQTMPDINITVKPKNKNYINNIVQVI